MQRDVEEQRIRAIEAVDETLEQNQVAGTRNRQKFGEPLDNSQQDRIGDAFDAGSSCLYPGPARAR